MASALILLTLFAVPFLVTRQTDPTVAAVTPPRASRDGLGIQVGTLDSPNVVVLYTDYQCGACARFNEAFFAPLRQGGDEGRYRFQIATMTFVEQSLNNDSSTRAAVAAACADTVGHYAELHDTIFRGQPAREGDGFTDAQLRQDFPAQVGIVGKDLTTFQTCYDQRSTLPFVTQVASRALGGIKGTPTLQVNGADVTAQVDSTRPETLAAVLPR